MTNRDQHFRKPDPVVVAFCTLTLISCLGVAGPWTMAGGAQPADWPEWMHDFKGY